MKEFKKDYETETTLDVKDKVNDKFTETPSSHKENNTYSSCPILKKLVELRDERHNPTLVSNIGETVAKEGMSQSLSNSEPIVTNKSDIDKDIDPTRNRETTKLNPDITYLEPVSNYTSDSGQANEAVIKETSGTMEKGHINLNLESYFEENMYEEIADIPDYLE